MLPNDITKLELVTRRGNFREVTEISPKELVLVAEDVDDGALPVVRTTWKGDYLHGLPATLKDLKSAREETDPEYWHELKLTFSAEHPVGLLWGSGSEDAGHRAFREAIATVAGLRYKEAERLLESGRKASAAGKFEDASLEFKRGIRVLGNLYWEPKSLDHTGQKLVAAYALARDGHKDVAASTQERVLETRLKGYLARQLPH